MKHIRNTICLVVVYIVMSVLQIKGFASESERFKDKIIGPQVYDRRHLLKFQNDLQTYLYDRGHLVLLETECVYDFNDYLGIEVTLPTFISLRIFTTRLASTGDLGLKLLWNFYRTEYNIATFRAGVWLPTGRYFIPDLSLQSIFFIGLEDLIVGDLPNTGRGTTSFMSSLVCVHNSPNWYARFKFGGIIAAKTNGAKSSSVIFYQFLLGPKLHTKNDRKLIAGVELNSAFDFPQYFKGAASPRNNEVPESGVFVGLAGPYLAYQTDKFLIEARAQWPFVQVVSVNKRNIEHFFSFKVTVGL